MHNTPSPSHIALLAALALAGCGGSGGSSPGGETAPPPGAGAPKGSVVCKDYDMQDVTIAPKTITIRNNADEQIYPVLSTSTNAENLWVQGCLRTTEALPTDVVYKLYVNDGQGIPPGSEVTITLPLYSELGPRQYITWWNGGRVLLADRNKRLRNDEDKPLATPAEVTCQAQGTACALTTYASEVQFPEDAFAQLSEYTFGDSDIPAGQAARLLKPANVGYNISYVDHVYMPVAIGPKDNPYIGYSGSVQKPVEFRKALRSFLGGLGEGWPVYNMSEVRLPGGYNIFAQRGGYLIQDPDVPVQPPDGQNPPVLTVKKCLDKQCTPEEQRSLQWGQSVQNIQDLWGACVDWGNEDLSAYTRKKYPQDCPAPQAMRDKLALVKDFFAENHKKYLAMYDAKQCTDDLGMSAYGFSVDDAVGFMSELGNGLVFTVGGVQGLENARAFNYHDGFDVLLGNPADRVPENKPLLKKYGACSLGQNASDPDCNNVKQDVLMPDANRIVGFRVGTLPSYPMKVRFTDAQDNVYTLLVKEKFAACTGALANCPPNRASIVDSSACSVMTPRGDKHPKSDTWCVGANPNQSRENDEAAIKNHLSFPVPVQYLP